MPGEVNCIFTKVLIPCVEKEVGPEGVAAILRTAGRSRDYLVADHNWLPLPLFNELVRLAMDLMGETDEERWTRRYTEYLMEWRPSRADRHYLGTSSMALAHPPPSFPPAHPTRRHAQRVSAARPQELGPPGARVRGARGWGDPMPQWSCTLTKVGLERAPTVWGLPPATVTERQCATRGADACVVDVRWTNPPLGRPFWTATLAGAAGSTGPAAALGPTPGGGGGPPAPGAAGPGGAGPR